MPLSYKNLAFEEIVRNYRDMRYANGALQYGFTNTISRLLTISVDPTHLSMQADVFTQGMDKLRSELMLKKYISAKPTEWSQMLHETYVYDRLRCLFYGFRFNSIVKLPENINAFPGNVVLMHLVARRVFKFELHDDQPFTMNIVIDDSVDFATLIKPVLDKYPNIQSGLSNYSNNLFFYNSHYERILTGLYNDRVYLNSRKRNNSSKKSSNNNNNNNVMDSSYEITFLTDEKVLAFLSQDSNPISNSFLNKDLSRFLYSMPYDKSGPQALRYNESLFLARAVGFTSANISYEGNSFYKSIPRNLTQDILTREEVFSVTGLKCNAIPRSEQDMNFYLKVVNLINDLVDGIVSEDGEEDSPITP